MRRFLGVLCGLVAVFITVSIVESINNYILYPPPPGVDLMNDPEALAAHMAGVPFAAQAIVIIGWFLGSLAGGLVAMCIARWYAAAWVIAGTVILLCIINLAMFPHPLWMQIAAVAAPLAGGYVATRFGSTG